jgi:hypothetical protein
MQQLPCCNVLSTEYCEYEHSTSFAEHAAINKKPGVRSGDRGGREIPPWLLGDSLLLHFSVTPFTFFTRDIHQNVAASSDLQSCLCITKRNLHGAVNGLFCFHKPFHSFVNIRRERILTEFCWEIQTLREICHASTLWTSLCKQLKLSV